MRSVAIQPEFGRRSSPTTTRSAITAAKSQRSGAMDGYRWANSDLSRASRPGAGR
jgi:hypothetical protein